MSIKSPVSEDSEEDAENKKETEELMKRLAEFKARLEALRSKGRGLNKKNDKDLEEYYDEIRDLSSDIHVEIDSLAGVTSLIKDPSGKGKTRIDILESMLGGFQGMRLKVAALSEKVYLEKRNRYHKMGAVKKWWYGPPEKKSLAHFPAVIKGIKKLEKEYGDFSEKVEQFKKRESLEKVDMNMDDLTRIGEELRRFSSIREKYLNDVISTAAAMGIDIKIEKREGELSGKLVVDLEKMGEKAEPFWPAVTTLNSMAEGINSLHVMAENRKKETMERVEKLMLEMNRIKSAEKKLEKEVRAKVQSDLKVKRERINQGLKNVGVLADLRLRYTPLSPAEAEQLKRKREYLDELRVQQEMHSHMKQYRSSSDFSIREEIISLSKKGALKAEQIAYGAWEGATEVISELGGQGLHLADMSLGGAIAVPVKVAHGVFDTAAKLFAVPGAYLYEGPRDTLLSMINKDQAKWKKEKTGFWGRLRDRIKWGGVGLAAAIPMAIGGPCRLASKICNYVRTVVDYDRMVKENRGMSFAAGAIGTITLVAATIASAGLIWIPIAGGAGLGTAHSVKRAVERASSAAKEVANLELSPDNAYRLALYEYDNPTKIPESQPEESVDGLPEHSKQAMSSSEAPSLASTVSLSLVERAGAVVTGAQALEAAQRSVEAREQNLGSGVHPVPIIPLVQAREAADAAKIDTQRSQQEAIQLPSPEDHSHDKNTPSGAIG